MSAQSGVPISAPKPVIPPPVSTRSQLKSAVVSLPAKQPVAPARDVFVECPLCRARVLESNLKRHMTKKCPRRKSWDCAIMLGWMPAKWVNKVVGIAKSSTGAPVSYHDFRIPTRGATCHVIPEVDSAPMASSPLSAFQFLRRGFSPSLRSSCDQPGHAKELSVCCVFWKVSRGDGSNNLR